MDLSWLYKVVDAVPFRPFEIALLNGERARVDHPENIIFFPNRQRVATIHVTFPDGDYTFFWPDAIAAVHIPGGDGAS